MQQSFAKYLRQTLVFMWNSALQEKFRRFLLALTKFLFREEDWALGSFHMKFSCVGMKARPAANVIFLIFPKASCIYQFVINNHTSFYLWWKENLLNHQKVQHEHDWNLTGRPTTSGKPHYGPNLCLLGPSLGRKTLFWVFCSTKCYTMSQVAILCSILEN